MGPSPSRTFPPAATRSRFGSASPVHGCWRRRWTFPPAGRSSWFARSRKRPTATPLTRTSSASTTPPTIIDNREMGFRGRLFLGSALVVAALALVTTVGAIASGRARLQRAIQADFAAAPDLLRVRLQRSFDLFKWEVASWADDKRYAAWLGRASAADTFEGKAAPADLKAAHDGLGALALANWDEF